MKDCRVPQQGQKWSSFSFSRPPRAASYRAPTAGTLAMLPASTPRGCSSRSHTHHKQGLGIPMTDTSPAHPCLHHGTALHSTVSFGVTTQLWFSIVVTELRQPARTSKAAANITGLVNAVARE